MTDKKTGGRAIKKKIREWLEADDMDHILDAISCYPARRSVNPLFGLLYSQEEIVRWRAVTAMGAVVAKLADRNMESARVIMRRLLWNMNEESGGIGWGSSEAMGEIMARHARLADEYASILVSYISSERNFVEFEMLQRGVLWGIGRLALVRPELVQDGADALPNFMTATDATLRGLAAWIAGSIREPLLREPLKALINDEAIFSFYRDGQLATVSVGELARSALLQMSNDQ
jgi:hypothetical protein